MSDGKVPMPASGQGSTKIHSDGVGDDATQGRSIGGESGGGSYDNPHTGKEARGESGDYQGGQSVQGYFGPGQADGEKANPDTAGAVGQGGTTPGGDLGESAAQPAPAYAPRVVGAGDRSFDIVETSGVAEAEVHGKVGTDAPYEAEQESPGSG
ncbi:hypothetical protein ACFOKI_05080 [Sphingomonas qilianensis]|uniref:Uncharacterized protein n=1 Tax=Sphingomonas qilianensis TaxID=1736690 RepID=A0ABU9XUP4_9SPHN